MLGFVMLATVVGDNKIDNDEKCSHIDDNVDGHAARAIQCDVHQLMEHIHGFV